MFHRSRDKFPVDDSRLKHLRDRLLRKHAVLLALYRKVDVDAAAFRRCDLHVQAILRQEDMARVRRVQLDRRRNAGDLELERRRVGDCDGGDDGLDEDARLRAVD